MHNLVAELDEIVALEHTEPTDRLAGYIVGEIVLDVNEKGYAALYDTNTTVQEIGDLASDIEISNGSPDQLAEMWRRIKYLNQTLR